MASIPECECLTFGVGVFGELLLQSVQGEGTELLQADQRRVLGRGWQGLPLLEQGVVVFAGAQQHPLDAGGNYSSDLYKQSWIILLQGINKY